MRETVLRSAARVFERNGYAGSSIADILDEGGVTKGALYFHFASKEDLAHAIVSEQTNWRSAHTAPDDDPVRELVDMSYAFVEALQKDPLVRASIRLTLERNTFQTDDPGPYRGWLAAVESMLVRARRAGRLIAGVDPKSAAYVITAAITGLQLVSEATTGRTDLRKRVDQMWQILLPTLVPADVAAELRPARRTRRTSRS